MRLGQLSRKVDTKPSEILSYLKNEFDVELGSHLNTKVDDALTEKVIAKFKAVVISESTIKTEDQTDAKVEVEKEPELESDPIEETNVEETEKPEPIAEFDRDQEIDEATRLSAEVIKAPKVELAGPTVVGKIDLPPPLEEQMVEIDGVMISKKEIADKKKEERKQKREKRETSKKRTSGSVRSSRIKSEAQLEQLKKDTEAEEISKKIAHREKRISKKQKQQAKPKVNPTPPKKKVKKKTIKKQIIAEQEAKQPKNIKPMPTTWYGKLWLWFNT